MELHCVLRCRPWKGRSAFLASPPASQAVRLSPAVAPQAVSAETKQEWAGVSWCPASLMLAVLIAGRSWLRSHNTTNCRQQILIKTHKSHFFISAAFTQLLRRSNITVQACAVVKRIISSVMIVILLLSLFIYLVSEQLCSPSCDMARC